MARIPDETLQSVLQATDIVDLIGRYVKLRRVGLNWRGLCPFHNEKTPSFYVNPQRNSYHCFGCGVGGTAIRFLMEHENLQFMEAVKRLADAAHIPIHEEVWDAQAERSAKIRSALVRVHKELAEWFHQLLMRSASAVDARSYLQSRDIHGQTAQRWQMGYAPASMQVWRQWAADKKYSDNFMVHAGLWARSSESSRQSNELYPRFRHRLMFPIRNDFGEIIAFSGRLLDENAKAAKYLNSPETPLFNKSKVLFGLDKAKRAIVKAGRAIVCEGQLDMISAFEHGIENVVAPLGTAFTEFHARTLKRHAEEVLLCFDSDAAGFKAAQRAYGILAPEGLIVKAVALPAGQDPDSLIRQQGVEALQQVLETAKDFVDHSLDHAFATRNLQDMREKIRLGAEMAPMIRLLEHPISRDTALKNVALRLGISEADYRRQVMRLNITKTGAEVQTARVPVKTIFSSQEKNAAMLCKLAISDAAVLQWLRSTKKEYLLQELAGCELLSLVWNSELNLADSTVLASFIATLDREEERAMSLLMSQPMPVGGLDEAFQALERLELKWIDTRIELTQTQLKQPQLTLDRIVELNQTIVELRKEYLDRSALMSKLSSSAT